MLDAQGGSSVAKTLGDLACLLDLPIENLEETIVAIPTSGQNVGSRDFSTKWLKPL